MVWQSETGLLVAVNGANEALASSPRKLAKLPIAGFYPRGLTNGDRQTSPQLLELGGHAYPPSVNSSIGGSV